MKPDSFPVFSSHLHPIQNHFVFFFVSRFKVFFSSQPDIDTFFKSLLQIGRPKQKWQTSVEEELKVVGIGWDELGKTCQNRAHWGKVFIALCSPRYQGAEEEGSLSVWCGDFCLSLYKLQITSSFYNTPNSNPKASNQAILVSRLFY